MKIVFFSSPAYAIPLLKKILFLGHELSLVVTQGTNIKRRGKVVKTAVHEYCDKHNINYIISSLLDSDSIKKIKELNCDLGIIYAYGKMIPKEIIEIPKYKIMNLHCSLLPAYKGAAPIQHAILDDCYETGITYFEINNKLDDGKILLQDTYKILETDNCASVQDNLTNIALTHLEEAIYLIQEKRFTNTIYKGHPSYANKIDKKYSEIDWDMNVRDIHNRVRALHQWPCVTVKINNTDIQILEAHIIEEKHDSRLGVISKFNKDVMYLAVKGGYLSIKSLRIPGKNIISNQDLYNSNSSLKNSIIKSLSDI